MEALIGNHYVYHVQNIMEIKQKEMEELTPKNVILDLFFILLPRFVKCGNRAWVGGLKSRQSDKCYSNRQQHGGYQEHQFDTKTPRFISASAPSECCKKFIRLLKLRDICVSKYIKKTNNISTCHTLESTGFLIDGQSTRRTRSTAEEVIVTDLIQVTTLHFLWK